MLLKKYLKGVIFRVIITLKNAVWGKVIDCHTERFQI